MALFGGKKGNRVIREAPTAEQCAMVGLFGKHPSSREFYRVNAGSVVREFDDWLGRALALCQQSLADWPTCYDRGPIVSFLYRGQTASRVMVGTLAPSQDQQRRRFPLIVFAEIDSSVVVDQYPALPYLRFIQDVEAGLERRKELTPEMLDLIPERLRPPDRQQLRDASGEHQRRLHSTTVGQLLSPLFQGARGGQLALALDHLRVFGRLLGQGQAPNYGLRCPISLAMPLTSAALWLQLVRNASEQAALPSVFWTDRAMVFFARQPSSKALAPLWQSSWQDDTVLDLVTAEGHAGPTPNAEQSLRALLDQP